MKKNRIIILIFVLIAITVGIWWFTRKTAVEVLRYIPDSYSWCAHISAAELKSLQPDKYISPMKNSVWLEGLPGEALEGMAQPDAITGIDGSQGLWAFQYADEKRKPVVLMFALRDADLWSDWLAKKKTEGYARKESRGVQSYISQTGTGISWDNHVAVFVFDGSPAAAANLLEMKLDLAGGLNDFAKNQLGKSGNRFVVRPEAWMRDIENPVAEAVLSQPEISAVIKNTAYAGEMVFEPGTVKMTAEYFPLSPNGKTIQNPLRTKQDIQKYKTLLIADHAPAVLLNISSEQANLELFIEQIFGKPDADVLKKNKYYQLLQKGWNGDLILAVSQAPEDNNLFTYPDVKCLIGAGDNPAALQELLNLAKKELSEQGFGMALAVRNAELRKEGLWWRPFIGSLKNSRETDQSLPLIQSGFREYAESPVYLYARISELLKAVDPEHRISVKLNEETKNATMHLAGNGASWKLHLQSAGAGEHGLITLFKMAKSAELLKGYPLFSFPVFTQPNNEEL
ncbi:MAG: hypothetical protein JNK73_02885 [Bacteroidia bacterium]|nr:hypothetical protein [Bacteroidia bacterium]